MLCNQNHQQVPNDFDEKGHFYYRLIQLKNRDTLFLNILISGPPSVIHTTDDTTHSGTGSLLPGHLLAWLQLPKENTSYRVALAYTQSNIRNR